MTTSRVENMVSIEPILSPEANVIKHFMTISNKCAQRARVFVRVRLFQPILMLVGKARRLP
jgi:hypothetical protein